MSQPEEGKSAAAREFESVLAPLRSSPRPDLEQVPDSRGVPLIAVEGLGKSFGAHKAVDGLRLEVYPGEIVGLLGPNGAGKTTTLRMLATVLKPDRGRAILAGHALDDIAKVRPKIGYMPDFIGTYDDLQVWECMEFFARAYAVKERKGAIDDALSFSELSDLKNHLVEELSRAQRQRLALARLLMHDPPILLLDEPLAGLDPQARGQMRDLLAKLGRKGKALVVTSSLFEELSDVCSKIAVVEHGELLAFEDTAEFIRHLNESRRWRVRVREPEEKERLRRFLAEQAEMREVSDLGEALCLTFAGGDEVAETLHQRMFEHQFRIVEFAEEPLEPQELYLRLMRDKQ